MRESREPERREHVEAGLVAACNVGTCTCGLGAASACIGVAVLGKSVTHSQEFLRKQEPMYSYIK